MAYTQKDRQFRIETPLGSNALLLAGFNGTEGVSTPFSFTLELLSENASIDPNAVLREPATITLLVGDKERVIHGRINRFVQLGQGADLTEYRAEFVPWLWFLSLSSDCRIFQQMTVLEIVEQVFKDQGYNDFAIECSAEYAKRDYCVQYRETHLDFVSRLLEEEGIFYFFRHSNSMHELVLADAKKAIKPCPLQSTAKMRVQTEGQEENVILGFEREHSAFVGTVTLRNYDFLQPSVKLESSVSGDGKEEVYDYPEHFTEQGVGDARALVHLEEQEAWHEMVRGDGNCRAFQSGCSFDLEDHYRGDVNQAYLLLTVHHWGRAGGFRPGESDSFEYQNDFVAIPNKVPYRPQRTTPKPVVRGSQTALVVGPKGSEIHVDEYGRVKVQFYWDRLGKKDDASSCWIRVASSWAGKNWGFVQVPRVGQEVLIDFLEGNPDLPIVTGRVYNADQMPPYDLPANKTQSGVKTRSTLEGGPDNFNEIRFEDKKGEEQVYIHAEKDKQVVVENDRTESVGNDETITIGNDRTENVENDETITIKNNRTESVGKDESITIGENRTESVGKDETIDIGANRNETVAKNEDVSIGDNRTHNVGKNDVLDVGKNLAITAGDSITIKTGSASITMKKNGDIQIKGKNIRVQGSGKIQIKASSDVNIKGSKVTAN